MNICLDYKDCTFDSNTVLTVGTFDGVHAGHRQIIETLKARARSLGCRSCLVTFNPHPQQILKKEGKKNIGLLTSFAEKRDILRGLGIDNFVIIPFTFGFSQFSAEEFVGNVLLKYIGMKEIVVGHDHAFGKGREGTIDSLKSFGNKWGFDVVVVPPLFDGGEPVSSTRIRALVQKGAMENVQRYLCRPYCLRGMVIHGNGRGRLLNYPTANVSLEIPEKLLVPDGIYACEVEVRGKIYRGIVIIGFRPTFQEQIHSIEVHILDFHEDIYGESISIGVLRFLRDEIRFDSEEALVKQMDQDQNETVQYFKNKPEIECAGS